MWKETLGVMAEEMEIIGDEIGEDRSHCSFTSSNTTWPTLDKLHG